MRKESIEEIQTSLLSRKLTGLPALRSRNWVLKEESSLLLITRCVMARKGGSKPCSWFKTKETKRFMIRRLSGNSWLFRSKRQIKSSLTRSLRTSLPKAWPRWHLPSRLATLRSRHWSQPGFRKLMITYSTRLIACSTDGTRRKPPFRKRKRRKKESMPTFSVGAMTTGKWSLTDTEL